MLANAIRGVQRLGRQLYESPLPTLLLALSIVFIAFLYPTVGGSGKGSGGGIAFPDVLIGAMIVSSIIHLTRGDWFARDAARAISVPVLLIGLAALIGSLHAGLQGWIVEFFVRDIAVILTFFSALNILRRDGPRTTRLCFGALGICIILAAVQLGTSSGSELRASGTFPNPNIPGNLLATAILCWTPAPFHWSSKGAVIFIVLTGLFKTASFGSILQLSVGFGYLAICHLDAANRLMRGRRLAMDSPDPVARPRRRVRLHPAQWGAGQVRVQSSPIRPQQWDPRSGLGASPRRVTALTARRRARIRARSQAQRLCDRTPLRAPRIPHLTRLHRSLRASAPVARDGALRLGWRSSAGHGGRVHRRELLSGDRARSTLLAPAPTRIGRRKTIPADKASTRRHVRVTRLPHDLMFDRSKPMAQAGRFRAPDPPITGTMLLQVGTDRSGRPRASLRVGADGALRSALGMVFP